MPQQMIWFFVSIAFSFIAWGIVTDVLHATGRARLWQEQPNPILVFASDARVCPNRIFAARDCARGQQLFLCPQWSPAHATISIHRKIKVRSRLKLSRLNQRKPD